MVVKFDLICADCLSVMKNMKDKSIDCVVTDPPYGINENFKKNNTRGKASKPTSFSEHYWDKEKIKPIYFEEMKRISKNQIIFGGNYYCSLLGDTSCFIVWDKNNTGDFADCELAWTSFKSATRLIKCTWNGMLQYDMKNKEKRYHLTQKPLPVMRWVIERYTQPGELIFDPFMGSGTTGVVCNELDRQFIGVDIQPEYVEIARKRIENENSQIKMNLYD